MVRSLLLTALFLVACASADAQLVMNGDFEIGDLTGWSIQSGAPGVATTAPHTGIHHFYGHAYGSGGGLMWQRFATTPGATYDLLFWSRIRTPDRRNVLIYRIDSSPVITAITTDSYSQTLDSFTATGPSTVLSFEYATGPASLWFIDDVSVTPTPVPTPSAFALLALGGAGLLWRRRRARKA